MRTTTSPDSHANPWNPSLGCRLELPYGLRCRDKRAFGGESADRSGGRRISVVGGMGGRVVACGVGRIVLEFFILVKQQ